MPRDSYWCGPTAMWLGGVTGYRITQSLWLIGFATANARPAGQAYVVAIPEERPIADIRE
jgi:hypothetical protein